MDVQVGDTIEVLSKKVGQQARRGVVAEVLSTAPQEIRVTWDDGHETALYPNAGMVRVVKRASR